MVPNAPKADALRTPYFNDWKQGQVDVEENSEARPKAQSNQTEEHSTDSVATQVTTTGIAPTVLIVDDKEVQRTLVQMYLSRLGVNTLQAKNGENAVDLFRTNQVDLILMDVQMPVMNGFDASQIIKARSPNTPIIALSGESGQRELDMINQLMDGRLEKPTSLDALQVVLDEWLYKNTVKEASKEAESE